MIDEKLLIKKILKGDNASFSYFVDTYQDMSITIAYRICGNMQDAEDITQSAFVKAYHNLHTFKLQSKFSTWFFRIVYNTAITYIGSTPFRNETVDYDQISNDNYCSEWDTLEQIESNEKREIINKALTMLPRDENIVLTLFYMEDNSIKDIASIISLTEANIKVKLFRGRKRLAEILRPILMDYK